MLYSLDEDGEQGGQFDVGRDHPARLGYRRDGGSDAGSPAGGFGGVALAVGGPEAAINVLHELRPTKPACLNADFFNGLLTVDSVIDTLAGTCIYET